MLGTAVMFPERMSPVSGEYKVSALSRSKREKAKGVYSFCLHPLSRRTEFHFAIYNLQSLPRSSPHPRPLSRCAGEGSRSYALSLGNLVYERVSCVGSAGLVTMSASTPGF